MAPTAPPASPGPTPGAPTPVQFVQNYYIARDLLLPHMTPQVTQNLSRATNLRAIQRDYAMCIVTCGSGHHAHPLPVHTDWSSFGGFNLPVIPPGNGHEVPCANRALCHNPATANPVNQAGNQEPSYCLEPCCVPAPPFGGLAWHAAPDGQNVPLVCLPCKALRSAHHNHRKDEILFGACDRCHDWVVANLPIGSHCICEPHGNLTTGPPAGQPRLDHLCGQHEDAYWREIEAIAQPDSSTARAWCAAGCASAGTVGRVGRAVSRAQDSL